MLAIRLRSARALFLSIASAQVEVRPLFDLEGETSGPVLSPDGNTLAFEWWKADGIYTRAFAGGDVRLLAGKDAKDGSATEPRWSPDGKQFALIRFYSHYDNHLVVRGLAGGAERDLGNVCGYAPSGVWSPDSRFLVAEAYESDTLESLACRPALFSAETGKRVRFLALNGAVPAFSPDGRMLAYADGASLMLLRLTAAYEPAGTASVLAREAPAIGQVLWTPDGKQIVYQAGRDASQLRRISLTAGARPREIPTGDLRLSLTQLLADGSALATETTQVSALWRAELGSTPVKLQVVEHLDCSADSLCSPDGRHRVEVNDSRGILRISLSNADGSNQRPLLTSIPGLAPYDPGFPLLTGWSPDGKWIAFSVEPTQGQDLRSHLFVVPSSGGTPRRLGKEACALYRPVWSRDSKSLCAERSWEVGDEVHRSQSPIVLVDIADGRITPLGAEGIWPNLSPDGKFLYFDGGIGRFNGLSRMPVAGGPVEHLLDGQISFPGAVAGARYVYLLRGPSLLRLDLDSRQLTTLTTLPFSPRFLKLSADQRYLYLGQEENPKRRAVMVRGLR